MANIFAKNYPQNIPIHVKKMQLHTSYLRGMEKSLKMWLWGPEDIKSVINLPPADTSRLHEWCSHTDIGNILQRETEENPLVKSSLYFEENILDLHMIVNTQNGALRPPSPLFRSFAALFAKVALVKDRITESIRLLYSIVYKVSLSAK